MGKKLADVDKRLTPRISVHNAVKISDKLCGKLIDINDGGICFSVPRPITGQDCDLVMDFLPQPVKMSVKVKWNESSGEDGGSMYGASFIDPDKDLMTVIRRYMVTKQFRNVIRSVKDSGKRAYILRYAKNFRDYLFNLADLSNLISSRKISKEKAYSRLKKLTDDILEKGDRLRRDVDDKLLIRKIKHEFRALVGCWAFKSQIVKRGHDKPRGYPGDSDTLEVIYDKIIFSPETELGYFFDVYFLENPYAEAVRNRKDLLRDILSSFISERKDPVKILNLACGASRELWEMYRDHPEYDRSGVEFTLLDWDDNALEFSRNRLKNMIKKTKINFLKEDVMKFVRNDDFFKKNGRYDLIYSIGLADYLPDRVLKNLIKTSFSGLNKAGRFVVAHKDKQIVFSHLPPEWFCDWEFYSRDEEDLLALIRSLKLKGSDISIVREATDNIFFITIEKK